MRRVGASRSPISSSLGGGSISAETLLGLAIFALLWSSRRFLAERRAGLLFCLYLVLAGGSRFFVETIRLNPEVLWGLTGAQLFCVALIVAGIGLGARLFARPSAALTGQVKGE